MEEIGLQLETQQENVISAMRRYVSQGGMRLIEESPLRHDLQLPRPAAAPEQTPHPPRPATAPRNTWQSSPLATLFESYFDYYLRLHRQRVVLVGPTVGLWTAILYGEKAIDCRMVQWLSAQLRCRAVGYCFIENEEYSYIELLAGRAVEVFSSILSDSGGQNFWSAVKTDPPPPGSWVADGFLKEHYQFIPGFYDLPFVRGRKSHFTCYPYDTLPDLYDETDNYPLDAFRYFYFHCAPE
jgi:hypothetical protein